MITWKIEWMNVSSSSINGFQQVVLNAGWRCEAEENDLKTAVYGSISFPQPVLNGQFTPYNQLTEANVLSWVWENGVNKAETEEAALVQLNSLLNPPTVNQALPWAL
jgi:hypothetical protein